MNCFNIVINLRNVTSIIQNCPTYISDTLLQTLKFRTKGYTFSPAYRRHGWDGYTRLAKVKDGSLYFPTGLFRRVWDCLHELGMEGLTVTVSDERTMVPPRVPIPLSDKYILYPDMQKLAFESAINSERGILQLPTGSGKTILIAALSGHYNLPTLITTHQINILEHLKEDIQDALGIEVGIIQGKNKILHQFNIGTVQTIVSCFNRVHLDPIAADITRFVQTECQLWIADECHHLSADQFTLLSNRLYNTRYRFGFSATAFREDGADMKIEAGTGRKIYQCSTSDLIKLKRLSKPYIFFVSYPSQSKDKEIEGCIDCGSTEFLVEEKVNKFGLSRQKYGACLKCNKRWLIGHGIRIRGIVKNELRNNLVLHYALRMIRKGKTVLISTQYRSHCKKLYEELIKRVPANLIEYAMGGVDDRSEILKRLDRKETLCVVATSVFGEGVNCPGLHCLINARGSSNKTEVVQLVGRVLRRTSKKGKVIVIDFNDKFKNFSVKAKFRKDLLKEEPEFVVKNLLADVDNLNL